jgi:hypothetical protein
LEFVTPIGFQTRQLCVTYKHSTVATAAKNWILDPYEMAVLGKLTVMPKGKKLNESLVRYNMIKNRMMIVDGWQQ